MGADARRTARGWLLSLTTLVVAFLLVALPPSDLVPPAVTMVGPFVAAVYLRPRATALVASVATVETVALAQWHAGYEGAEVVTRGGMSLVVAAIAVVLASSRERHEHRLRRAEADALASGMMRAVAESSEDPIFVKDPDGRYLVANDAAAQAVGRTTADEVLGRRDRDLVPPDVAEWIEADDQHTLRAGTRLEFEDVIDLGDGTTRAYLTHKTVLRRPDGGVIGVAGVAKDVTARRAAEAELARSERRFRSLVEASAAIVFISDPGGRFLVPQPRWEAVTGQPFTEHRGFGWLAAVHPDDRRTLRDDLRVAAADRRLFESTVRIWHASRGEHRYFAARALPLIDEAGQVEEWLGTCTDVHDRFVADRQLHQIAARRALVAETASRVAVAEGVGDVVEAALAVLRERLPAHVAAVNLVGGTDDDGLAMVALSGIPDEVRRRWEHRAAEVRRPAQEVVATGRTLQSDDPAEVRATYPEVRRLLDELGVEGAAFAVPLAAGARRMGSLSLAFRAPVATEVVDSTRQALDEVAPVIAHSVAQARFQEMEVEIASSFQQSMLELALDHDPRLAVAVHYQAGVAQLEAGGDWYDVVPLADGRIALMVGDVVGRSLAAATVMGRLRAAARGLLVATSDPAEVIAHLDSVAATIDGAPFSTCCCVVLDPAREEAIFSSAAHPAPLVLRPGGEPELLWGAQGPPLAFETGLVRPVATTTFPVGSRMLLYTDGLVERRGESIDAGFERLVAIAAAGRDGAIGDECERLSAALLDGGPQRDDIAIVCAQLLSTSAAELHRRMGPDVGQLRAARRDLASWLAGHGIADRRAFDITLAVDEALANAIEHAGAPDQGIELMVLRAGGELRAVVADRGQWRAPSAAPHRGRGLGIIDAVADEVRVERGPGGTRVGLRFDVVEGAGAPG